MAWPAHVADIEGKVTPSGEPGDHHSRVNPRHASKGQEPEPGWSSKLAAENKASYAPVYIPAAVIVAVLTCALLYSCFAAVIDAFSASRWGYSSKGPDVNRGQRPKARSPITTGELWCVFDPHAAPKEFQYPESGVCDAFVYCCFELSPTGLHLGSNASLKLFAKLQLAAKSSRPVKARSPLSRVKTLAIVGRRDNTPALLKVQGAVGKRELVRRVVSWATKNALSGLLMNYDNDLSGDYYRVVRALYRRLHARGLWLMQLFDYNNDAQPFSAGTFVQRGMAPVVWMGHTRLEDYLFNLVCPAQFFSEGDVVWSFDAGLTEYAAFNEASIGRDCMERTMVTASFRGYHYTFSQHGRNSTRVGPVSYSTICTEQIKPDATAETSNESDCLVVRRRNHWYSSLGPESSRVFELAATSLGLLAFHAEQDDHAGRCGDRFPLLKAARDGLKKHAKPNPLTLT